MKQGAMLRVIVGDKMHAKRETVEKKRTSDGATTTFTYDLIDQLLTETKQGYSAEYTYDANGNRLTRTVNNVTEDYEYDDADKLLSVSINENPVKEYTYDDCGRLIEVESSAGITTLSWDYEDRLIGITYPNLSTNSFGYNGFGARISKSDSTGNYTFLRNGTGVTAPVLSDSYAEYTPGISERRSSNSKFYHSDLKNTTAQTNSDQNITGTNHYDAFGNLIDYSGTWNGPFTYGGAFGYQTDNDSGLMLLGHRYYDSSTGRFLSRDPIGDGSNWYAYCSNNPLKSADPLGLHTIVFDGNQLVVYDDDYKIIYRVPAASGKPGSSKFDQGISNYGPIPEGTYFIYPEEEQYSSWLPWTWPGAGYPFWDENSWGRKRVPLHASNTNPITDRSGFFLHGGSEKGSAGCIDIGPMEVKVISALADLDHHSSVHVTYSNWDDTTKGGPWSEPYRGGGTNGSGGRVTWSPGNWPRI